MHPKLLTYFQGCRLSLGFQNVGFEIVGAYDNCNLPSMFTGGI